MKTTSDKNGLKSFCAFGQYFFFGFGGWHRSYYDATTNMNLSGFKFKKDAIAYARKNKAKK